MIRHAPSRADGRLAGRTDVSADCSDSDALSALRAAIGAVDRRVISPARRCVETADALWRDLPPPAIDPRLWEQDFGAWEGRTYAELPDLGPLPPAALAAMRPPEGESFADVCARVAPAISDLASQGGRIAIVAHAGTVRAALALALGDHGGARGVPLAIQLAPLSLTKLTAFPGGSFSIDMVNWTAPMQARQARGNAACTAR